MTANALPAGDDPRRLLTDIRALAHRVRLDRRVTWFALLLLAAVTLVAIPIDWLSLDADCGGADGPCHIRRLNRAYYWLPALLLAYTAIAGYAVRAARARGLGARVLPYVLTGVALAVLSAAAWLFATLYWRSHPVPVNPLPTWMMVIDGLVAPAGTIGVALLVLAWLERHVALLVFTLGYLAVVLMPLDAAWVPPFGYLSSFLVPQLVNGIVLLLGAAWFAMAHRRVR
ncbi:hypothetical protein AB0J80_24960 [Actinoplanes sp. NPDC049548]|uniref:hypothetical protein n=1 Tax=Actinoplanes sp. NPDC049548 TaxID=3155152 RepID=UPI00342DBFDB